MTHLTGDFVWDVFPFGVVNGSRGRKELLSATEIETYRAAQQPKPLRIHSLLKLAYELQDRINRTPGLTQMALAAELGMSRVRVTQILNLLNLAPEVHSKIWKLTPADGQRRITETGLRRLTGITEASRQIDEFQGLWQAKMGDRRLTQRIE